MHRKPTPAEDYRKAHLNPPTTSQKTLLKSISQGLKESVEPISKSRMESSPYPIDYKELYKKLEHLKREQDKELQEHFLSNLSNNLSSKLHSAAQPRMLTDVREKLSNILNSTQLRGDVDCQSILDLHVSSVFSPRHTPGTTSPKNLPRPHQRSNEMSSSVPDFGKRNRQKNYQLFFAALSFISIFSFSYSHATDTSFAFDSRECINCITL